MKKPARKKKSATQRQAAAVVGQTQTLADQISGATELKFRPQDRAIDEELRSTKAHRGTIGVAFDTYKGRLDEIAAAQRKGWQDAVAQQAALGSQMKSSIGVGGTGNPELDAQLQSQQAAGNATEGAGIVNQGALLGNLGLAEGNDLSRKSAAIDTRRDERLAETDSRLREIGRKRTDLGADKGSFMVDLLRQIQQDDAKNAIAAEGLNVQRSKAANEHSEFLAKLDVDKLLARIKGRDIKHDNELGDATLTETGTHNRNTEQTANTKVGIDQQNANTNSRNADTNSRNADTKAAAGGKGGTAGMTRSERKSVFGDVRKLKSLGSEFAQLVVANGGSTSRASDAIKKRHRGLSEGDVNVARDLAQLGGRVSPANQTYLKTKYKGYLPRDFGGGKKKAKKKGK